MSSTPIPAFVDQILREWDSIAYFAYDGYETSGRGGVGLFQEGDKTKACYSPADFFHRQEDQRMIAMLNAYDPENEFLVHLDVPEGTRTIRVRTPENARQPKRVWFSEMLRKVSEEPDSLPQTLPEWFVVILWKNWKKCQQRGANERCGLHNMAWRTDYSLILIVGQPIIQRERKRKFVDSVLVLLGWKETRHDF